jgi:hypothetical protein
MLGIVRTALPILLVGASLALTAGSGLAQPDSSSACARGYFPCLPVRADMDCDQIRDASKPVRVVGEDRYGLDADDDGIGCETGDEGGGLFSRYGVVLRKGGKEVPTAAVGDTLTVVGWSPTSTKGMRYRLCSAAKCVGLATYVLKGTAPQAFGKWRVTRGDVRGGLVKISLKVGLRVRASDTVSIR